MATIRKRTSNKKNQTLSYNDLEQMGFGSWLKDNAGTIGTLTGAAIGTAIAPGIGTSIGASLGGSVGGGVQQNAMQDNALASQNAQNAQTNAYNQSQTQLKQLQGNGLQTYMPVAKNGGRLRRMATGGKMPVDNTRVAKPRVRSINEMENMTDYLEDSGNNLSIDFGPLHPQYTSSPIKGINLSKTNKFDVRIPGGGLGKALGVIGTFGPLLEGVADINYEKSLNPRQLAKYKEQKNKQLRRIQVGTQDLQNYEDSLEPMMKLANGGTINYNGQLHEGPDGGNPVDGQGNSNAENPVALTQKGEVSYITPDKETYIFSDDLFLDKGKTFAKEAKHIQSKYSKRLGKNMVEKQDMLASKGYNKDMGELLQKQEYVRDANGTVDQMEKMYGGMVEERQAESGLQNLKKGGGIHIKPENKGKFNALKKRTGKSTEELTHSKNPLTRKRAIFAQNAKKWKHEMGGELPKYDGLETEDMTLPGTTFRSDTADIIPNYEYYKDPSAYANNIQGIKGSNNFSTPQSNIEDGWKPYQGMGYESAIGLAAPLAGNIIGAIGANRRKGKNRIVLDESGAAPQGINLERERASLREQANLARANTRRGLKAGTSAQQYMANMGAAEANIGRGLGQQLGESYQKEEMYNNQLPAGGPSEQAKLQAQMYNSQMQNLEDAQGQQYMNNMLNAVNQWGSEMNKSKQNAMMLNMLNPNYMMEQSGKGLNKRYRRKAV